MLAKDELVRELILLLLRSLKGIFKKFTILMCTVRQRRQTDKHLHQLQVFEGRQVLWHNTELVSIQIPEQREEQFS